jgi:hypothetical protein
MRAHGRHCGQEDSQPDDVRYQRAEYQTGTGRKEGPVRGRLSIPAPLSRVSRPARHSAHEMALRDLRARLLLAPAFRMQICLYAEVEKFRSNVRRDKLAKAALRRAGWQVLVIWECEVNEKSLKRLVNEIRAQSE